MAHPIGFREANSILARPPSMTQAECSDLEVYMDTTYVVSRWQFTDDEIEALKKNGGKVYLMVIGGQPPVVITAISPFQTAKEPT